MLIFTKTTNHRSTFIWKLKISAFLNICSLFKLYGNFNNNAIYECCSFIFRVYEAFSALCIHGFSVILFGINKYLARKNHDFEGLKKHLRLAGVF